LKLEAQVEVGMVKVSLRLMIMGRVRVWVGFTARFKRCQTSSSAQNEQKLGSKYPV
jgi:hypothetical protein